MGPLSFVGLPSATLLTPANLGIKLGFHVKIPSISNKIITQFKGALASLASLVLLCATLIQACNKNDSSVKGEGRLQVWLTDEPGNFQQVLIDVQDIQINYSASNGEGWQSLTGINKGSYDLLTLVNDHDTLIADGNLPSGRLQQLRLILGPDNFVKKDDSVFRLDRLDSDHSGVTLKVQQDIGQNLVYKVVLDFDVAKSILENGDGTYRLRPRIRTVFESVGGGVRGWVRPSNFKTSVSAVQGNDTIAGTFTGTDGGYIIKGIAQGVYTLFFNPSDSAYADSSIMEVPVLNKEILQIDTVVLQQ